MRRPETGSSASSRTCCLQIPVEIRRCASSRRKLVPCTTGLGTLRRYGLNRCRKTPWRNIFARCAPASQTAVNSRSQFLPSSDPPCVSITSVCVVSRRRNFFCRSHHDNRNGSYASHPPPVPQHHSRSTSLRSSNPYSRADLRDKPTCRTREHPILLLPTPD